MDHATHAAGTRIDIPLLTSFIEQERERCKVPNCSYHELPRPGSRRARAPLPVGLHGEVQAAGVTHERVKKPSKACTSPRRLCVLPLRANRWRCHRANPPAFTVTFAAARPLLCMINGRARRPLRSAWRCAKEAGRSPLGPRCIEASRS